MPSRLKIGVLLSAYAANPGCDALKPKDSGINSTGAAWERLQARAAAST